MEDLTKQRVNANTRFSTKSLGYVTVRQAAKMGSFPVDRMVESIQKVVNRGCFRWIGTDTIDILGTENDE